MAAVLRWELRVGSRTVCVSSAVTAGDVDFHEIVERIGID
jgi:hypothetical protein